jgi:hypothetical protein
MFLRLAEGARFELAAHEVGAGFQDRWIKPLSHPSEICKWQDAGESEKNHAERAVE